MALDGKILRILIIGLYLVGMASIVVSAFFIHPAMGFLIIGVELLTTVFLLVKESGM